MIISLGKYVSITGGVPCEERHAFDDCMGADEEIREWRSFATSALPVLQKTPAGEECGSPWDCTARDARQLTEEPPQRIP